MRSLSRGLLAWRAAFALAVLARAGVTHAALPDLIAHNGFEACWSQAITQTQFLGLQQSGIEGAVACVPQSTGLVITGGSYSLCNTAACPGAVTGCPITLHSGPFGGTFSGGPASFSATGSADDIVVDVSYTLFTIPGSCTITASNISLGYALDYTLQADGNSGLYAVSLDQAMMVVENGYVLDGSDASCDIIVAAAGSLIIGQAEAAGANLLAAIEEPATVGESVCPLTP